jgi:hypothetical protein
MERERAKNAVPGFCPDERSMFRRCSLEFAESGVAPNWGNFP